MYRMAYYVTADRDDALDAVQNAVASLWENRDELDRVTDMKAYAIVAAKRHAIDLIRRRMHKAESIDSASACADPDADTMRRIEHADALSKVKILMESLNRNEREVMRLRSQAECSVKEIASITGYSEENVRQILSRARRKIKELYNRIK